MAGHSKWANIKYRKGREDAKKGKKFSRISKEIISAVKQGGADPSMNTKLRLALQKAKAANFPADNIERNIKKAINSDQSDFYEVTYEIYGHEGVGMIVDAMTDNKNRMASEIRIATGKKGGSIASPGSVTFNFDRKGVIQVAKDRIEEDVLFMQATDAGANDFVVTDNSYVIITFPSQLFEIKEFLELNHISIQQATLEMIPKTLIVCSDDAKRANRALIDYLEELDDVDVVFHNMQDDG